MHLPLDEVLVLLIKCLVFFTVGMLVVAYLVLAERKILGHMQSRMGPNRVGPLGLFQPFADVLKLISKEAIMPREADKFLYLLGPFFASVPAFMAFAVIPVGEPVRLFGRDIPLHLTDLNIGILYLLALSSLGVYGIFLAGWSSNNKFSLYGGLRSSAQMISYELGMGLSLMGVIMLTGSFSLVEVVNHQARLWNVVTQPVAYAMFILCGLAELNRAPFDLPEAESELVAGYHTEYSGMRFALFYLGEYINMLNMACLATLLFWGGWHGPGPVALGPAWFFLKVFAHLFFIIWTRATLPRLRYDQLMSLGWKVMLPVGLANILLTGLGIAFAHH